jgi:hypothetical protein
MDMHEPTEVYTVSEPFQAELIKDALQAAGIRCFLDARNQGGFAGMNMEPIRIIVQAIDADRARKLIESHQSTRAENGEDE